MESSGEGGGPELDPRSPFSVESESECWRRRGNPAHTPSLMLSTIPRSNVSKPPNAAVSSSASEAAGGGGDDDNAGCSPTAVAVLIPVMPKTERVLVVGMQEVRWWWWGCPLVLHASLVVAATKNMDFGRGRRCSLRPSTLKGQSCEKLNFYYWAMFSLGWSVIHEYTILISIKSLKFNSFFCISVPLNICNKYGFHEYLIKIQWMSLYHASIRGN